MQQKIRFFERTQKSQQIKTLKQSSLKSVICAFCISLNIGTNRELALPMSSTSSIRQCQLRVQIQYVLIILWEYFIFHFPILSLLSYVVTYYALPSAVIRYQFMRIDTIGICFPISFFIGNRKRRREFLSHAKLLVGFIETKSAKTVSSKLVSLRVKNIRSTGGI